MPRQPLPSLQPEEWPTERLANVAEFDPRYEASWYGPYNALLSHYFPYQQRFLVKPQPRIREAYLDSPDFSFSSIQTESSMEMDEPMLIDGDVSVTSIGGLAMPSGPTCIPDFIVAKATKFASHDKALLLIEIKPREAQTWSAEMRTIYQMDQYMETLVRNMPKNATLIGLLISGTSVEISRIQGHDDSRVRHDTFMYDISSTTIRELLLGIAEDNWDG